MKEITIWRPSARSQRLRLKYAAIVISTILRSTARPVPPICSSCRGGGEFTAPPDRKPAQEHELATPMSFRRPRNAFAESNRGIRKVGTMRIMGGISARRAVHRCPVADVFLGRSPTSDDEIDLPATTERATRPIQ